jgi:hypothetical protein
MLDREDEVETLVALLVVEVLLTSEETLDDAEDIADELLPLPVPTFDELFETTVPPVHAEVSKVIITGNRKPGIDHHLEPFISRTVTFNHRAGIISPLLTWV